MKLNETYMSIQPKERVLYLDLLKCLGMFIVVQGHIHTDYGWFSLPLHSFVIPLYFFLSGLTFRRSKFPNFKSFLKHRLKSLMLPYFIFSIATWCVWAGYNYIIKTDVNYLFPLLQTIFAQGSGNFLIHNVPLWFVPCLFVVECLYYFIDYLHNSKYIYAMLIIFASIGVWMINGPFSSFLILLPWSVEGAFIGILFYGTANLLTKKISLKDIKSKVVENKYISLLGIIIITIILIFTSHWNGHVSIGSDLLGKSALLFFVNAFLGIISITLFSILISSVKSDSNIFNKIMDFHYWFGRNSFYIMSTHVPIKGFLIVGLATITHLSKSFIVNDYLLAAIVFAITCILSSIAAIIVTKIKSHDEMMLNKIRLKLKAKQQSIKG